jgi:hypothetical protein
LLFLLHVQQQLWCCQTKRERGERKREREREREALVVVVMVVVMEIYYLVVDFVVRSGEALLLTH